MKTGVNNSKYNQLDNLRPVILAMMKEEGRNLEQCEECTQPIPVNEYEIHHTKYEGATYYDLLIVCRKCNRAPHNVGLA